jgi:hypothetical protein
MLWRRIAHKERLMIWHCETWIAFGEQMSFKDVVLRRGNFPARFVDDEG